MVISNRSVPTNILLPHIAYPDVVEAIEWLTRTFGFSEHYRYGQPVSGAQMHHGNAWFMLKKSARENSTPAQLGYGTQSLTVFLDDVDSHYEKSKLAGARILEDPHETVYGEWQYAAEDLAGHHWLFSRHARDLNPETWGATVSEPVIMPPQISPMLAVADANAAIEFYQTAFGATVRWSLGSGDHVVAGLAVGGAQFFLATESPSYGTRGPGAAGFTTVRIELFVDDPVAMHARALAAGGVERNPVVEHQYSMAGPHSIQRMLQGSLLDPSGHMWLVGKILD